MTDRELLELAAKAAGLSEGIGGAFWTNDGGVFDPLTDDGDALRLAVKLRIHLEFDPACVIPSTDEWAMSSVPVGLDPDAATRRAIVRAAAEIGKEKK